MQKSSILHPVKPPCPRCPYKLGLVHMAVCPCPQCKSNGYQMYEQLQKRTAISAPP